MGILTILLQMDKVTTRYLADRFEVTRRTISRDLDALCLAGIPVMTQQGGDGGVSLPKEFKLDKSILTQDELASILIGLKGLASVSRKSSIENILEKLSLKNESVVSLNESIIIDLASHYKGSLTEKIDLIKQGIRDHRMISFDYYYEKGETRRVIEPYAIVFQWTSWYVFGYCKLRDDFRMFKLNRLWDLSLTREEFSIRAIPPEKRQMKHSHSDKNTLIAIFDPTVKYQLIETYGIDSFQTQPDGRLRLEVGYTHRKHILSWVLSFGDLVTVIHPKDMVVEIRGIAQKILLIHE